MCVSIFYIHSYYYIIILIIFSPSFQDSVSSVSYFYGKKKAVDVTIFPEDPNESEDEQLADEEHEDVDDDVVDPDYMPPDDDSTMDDSAILEDEDDPAPSTSIEPSPKRKKKGKKRGRKTGMVVEPRTDEEAEEDAAELASAQLKLNWKKGVDISNPPIPTMVHPTPGYILPPYDYFRMFFTKELVDHIVYQTNLYATQKNVSTNFSTTNQEMLHFIAILLYMGVVTLPSLDDYWARKTRVPQVADIMGSKRFRLLRRIVHFNDNSQIHTTIDRFYKIRPILTKIRNSFLSVTQTPKQSVDEVMVGFKGKTAGNLRQYIKTKPTKWGYKLFCRASDDGFIHDMIIYQGKTTFPAHPEPLEEAEKAMPMSNQVVSVLARSMSPKRLRAIYADNFFTSINLVRHLQSLNCRYTGTARENRIGKPCLTSTDAMNKSTTARGTVEYCSSDDGILALKWKDNKVVTMLTNDLGVEPMSTVKRYSKKTKQKEDVECPSVIKNYNANMGGVDKSDMLVQLYKTPMKSKRWYLRIFAYCLDVSVVNAWLLYRRHATAQGEKSISLKQFRLDIYTTAAADSATPTKQIITRNHPACDAYVLPSSSRGPRNAEPEYAVRFDSTLFHCPIFGNRQTCKLCSQSGRVMRTFSSCSICKVHLCCSVARNCFLDYHTPVA